MKRLFTFKEGTSDKFWRVEVAGGTMTVVFGKNGTAGVSNVKEFDGEAESVHEAEKLIREKLKKGYTEVLDPDRGKFGEVEFWSLIQRSKNKAENCYEQVEILTGILAERSIEDIVEFEKIFRKYYQESYQSRLWAAAYIINGGCSDDGFDYFRGWLIAQGKEVFHNVLENPESLARVIKAEEAGEIECEDMLYTAGNAYTEKTGKDDEDFIKLIPSGLFEIQAIELDWEEEGDDLERMFPKLWKKFSG